MGGPFHDRVLRVLYPHLQAGDDSETALKALIPCTGCRHEAKCGADLLACDAYAMFAAGLKEARWKHAPRAPTHARYLALFDEAQ
jgi:hypothetical protein